MCNNWRGKIMPVELYTSGEYLEKHPTWHVEDSKWKASQILRMIRQNNIAPKTICEVGCGAGETLKRLQENIAEQCVFWGYEISSQAFELCQSRANERLHFILADIAQEEGPSFDLMLVIDLIEHLEDYYGFLRQIKTKSDYKILHIPLEMTVQSILRGVPMRHREDMGHIHYFTKEVALQVLIDTGYQILDYFYTAGILELPARSLRKRILRIPKKLLFVVNKDWAVRVLTGFSLMVLAK